MPWLKLLHIGAVIVWCGALLYLPALMAVAARSGSSGAVRSIGGGPFLLRNLYTGVVTPAALVAIISGTWIFAMQGPVAPWLMAKLGLVGLLVLAHGLCGMLVLRSEQGKYTGLGIAGWVVMLVAVLCLLAIAALVLRKPGWP